MLAYFFIPLFIYIFIYFINLFYYVLVDIS